MILNYALLFTLELEHEECDALWRLQLTADYSVYLEKIKNEYTLWQNIKFRGQIVSIFVLYACVNCNILQQGKQCIDTVVLYYIEFS